MTADTMLVVATGVIAIATAGAAAGAFCAARATRRTSETQLFTQIMSEYASSEMGEALRHLRVQYSRWANDPSNRPFERLVEAWANTYATSGSSGDRTDSARRLVSHFFQKVTRIVEEGLVRGGLRQEFLSLSGKDLMYDIVIPLDRALAKHIKTEAGVEDFIERFQRVFPEKRPRAVQSSSALSGDA
jgi:hypothetical protein